MLIDYICHNTECKQHNVVITNNIMMKDTSKEVLCTECKKVIKRDWCSSSVGVKTGDGYKA